MGAAFRLFLLAALGAVWGLPAAAQPARSTAGPGGSTATVAEATAGVSLPDSVFLVQSVRQLSDTTALQYGRWERMYSTQDSLCCQIGDSLYRQATMLATFKKQDWPRWVERYREYQISVKLLNRDSANQAAAKPGLKKAKARRRKSGLLPAGPFRPPPPAVGLVVALVLLLGGAGRPWPVAGSLGPDSARWPARPLPWPRLPLLRGWRWTTAPQ